MHGLIEGLLLFRHQRVGRLALLDRLDIAARILAAEDARKDDTIVVGVKQGNGIAQVTAHIVKGAEAHDADTMSMRSRFAPSAPVIILR